MSGFTRPRPGLRRRQAEVKLVKSVGTDCELLDRDQVRSLEPGIRMNVLGGISYPEDSHLIPGRFVRGLADHLARQGVEVLPFTEVFDFETIGQQYHRGEDYAGRLRRQGDRGDGRLMGSRDS